MAILNVFPLRESASIMFGNGKGFKLEELHLEVHSLSSEQVFLSIQLKLFQSLVDGLLNFLACEFYHSLFHILTMKSSCRFDRFLFLFQFF